MSENVSSIQSNSYAALGLETDEEFRKRQRAAREQTEQICLQARITSAISSTKSDCIDKYDSKIAELETQSAGIETEKREDGSSKLKKKRGKGLWGKIKQWGSNALTEVVNIGKSLIGLRADGSFDLKQAGTNALLLGACFIPYIGPFIRLGLCGYGVYKGIEGTKDGIQELKQSDNDEDTDKAQQKICGAVITGILSLFGLRGMGKALRTNPATAAKASAAKVKPNATPWQTAKAGVSNFFRDCTYNAVRGAFHEAGLGFGALKSLPALLSRFKATKKNTEQPLTQRISELNREIAHETNPTYKALLEEELELVKTQHSEISSLENMTQTQLKQLRQNNAATKIESRISGYEENAGMIVLKRNGKTYKISKDDIKFKQFKEAMQESNKTYSTSLEELISARERIMAKYANNPKKYTTELDNYTQMSIRNRFRNAEELENGIICLESRLAAASNKIAELEGRLSSVRGKTAKRIRNQIKAQKKIETSVQEELELCKSIKFKKWYKPSTWRKNKYQLALKGTPKDGFGTKFGGLIRSGSASAIGLSTTCLYPNYSDAIGYSTELSSKQTEKILGVMSKYVDAFKIARENLANAENDDDIEQYSNDYDILNEKYQQEINAVLDGTELPSAEDIQTKSQDDSKKDEHTETETPPDNAEA